MTSNPSDAEWLRKAAAFLGASGVALGAIGAHAFKDTLTQRGMQGNWQTATIYQLFHATALLGLASQSDSVHPLAGKLLALGSVMFSGSIYMLCLGIGPKAVLGPTTPLGGMLMIGGWAFVGIGGLSDPFRKGK
mmetsp:Transcript_50645/g.147324  ORF Transcript_50645/g.147324 Transcript_50645/m.147324 type:complete len:134 (+) Transcript_50645:52-453(+)